MQIYILIIKNSLLYYSSILACIKHAMAIKNCYCFYIIIIIITNKPFRRHICYKQILCLNVSLPIAILVSISYHFCYCFALPSTSPSLMGTLFFVSRQCGLVVRAWASWSKLRSVVWVWLWLCYFLMSVFLWTSLLSYHHNNKIIKITDLLVITVAIAKV